MDFFSRGAGTDLDATPGLMGEELHWTGDSCLCWRSKQEVQLGCIHFLVHEEDLQRGRTALLFIYWLHSVLVVAHGIFSCSMWDLVPWAQTLSLI